MFIIPLFTALARSFKLAEEAVLGSFEAFGRTKKRSKGPKDRRNGLSG
jgi:hypothetical protein